MGRGEEDLMAGRRRWRTKGVGATPEGHDCSPSVVIIVPWCAVTIYMLGRQQVLVLTLALCGHFITNEVSPLSVLLLFLCDLLDSTRGFHWEAISDSCKSS